MIHKIVADGLCLFRGERCLFSGLGFALNSGELLLLRGPNGSGKTSLLRGLCGLLEFEEGGVSYDDQPVRRDMQSFRGRMVWFGHKHGFKGELTAAENLAFESSLRPSAGISVLEALQRVNLEKQRSLPFRSLSAGQQKRVALARLVLSAAPVWIMDEPYTNLDVDGRALVDRLVQGHLDEGGMALVATHHDMLSERTPKVLEISG